MMKRAWCLLLGVAALTWATEAGAEDKKEQVVEIDGLKAKAPASWKVEDTGNNKFRSHQFRVPKVKGDENDAEIVIFYFGEGGGGGIDANIERWKGLVIPPEGKKIDDVSKVEKLKSAGGVKMTVLDASGTYLFKERPNDPNSKTEKRPDSRLIGVVFESPKGPYFIRFVGPAKTVGENEKAFKEMLKNFKE